MFKLQKCVTLQLLHNHLKTCVTALTVSCSTAKEESTPALKKGISKAMKAYLERASQHDQFMEQQRHEFQIGKRHLANMMGEDPETFTQKDIDEAIEYLFPSGLFEPKARPLMKPPEELYPQRKAAEFDETGRPFHFLFYTGKPNYYKLLYDIVGQINELNEFEDKMIRKNLQPDPNVKLTLTGQWLSKDALEKMLLESISDKEHMAFVTTMDRLTEHPYSYRIKDFIMKYQAHLSLQTKIFEITPPKYDEQGRAYVTTYECLRKRARGHVTVFSPGRGIISINGQDLNYFKEIQPREQVSEF